MIQQAIEKGIISNQGKFNPDQQISREEMAVWLVNCLGYQDIARMKNQISVPFQDISQISDDKLNYVGLVSGLGLMDANAEQKFRPNDPLTLAEMAIIGSKMIVASRTQSKY